MAFSNTFESLRDIIVPSENIVELSIDNNNVSINPNVGSYFFLNGIDDNLTINIESLNSDCKTLYIKLSFENDNIVINWPSNIKWYDILSPSVSKFEDLFIQLIKMHILQKNVSLNLS